MGLLYRVLLWTFLFRVHGPELPKSVVWQRFVDVVTALEDGLSPAEIGDLGGEAFIPVIVLEKEDLINSHRVDHAVAFGLWA